MNESTARQLFELLSAFLTGASLSVFDLPFYVLRQMCPRLGALWDLFFCTAAGFLVFAAGQRFGGGIRLRFLMAVLLGAALCARLLQPVRSGLRRAAARKEPLGEDGTGKKEKAAEKCAKKR